MRIALIVGSAEPGRDGIGDHAARLAGALAGRGHRAWVLAINDRHVRAPGSTTLDIDGREVVALRIPARASSFSRFALARVALENAEPEAVLYNFTATHYDARGLIWPQAGNLAELAGGRRRAILLHEYCLGSERGAGRSRRLWGAAQRAGFRRFARRLTGARLAATNPLYAAMLRRDGFAADVVALFGNIPVRPPPAANWCHARLREAGIAGAGGREYYCAGFFGSLYAGADLAAAVPMLQPAARAAGGRLAILSVGEQGAGATQWQAWQARFGPGTADDIAFLALGRQDAVSVSAYIGSLDLGLASVPMALAGKSGTLAAFADHGLRALVINDSVHYDFFPDNSAALPQGALACTERTAALLAAEPLPPRRLPSPSALEAAADWVEDALAS